jgi:hypothetical protein
LGDKAGLYFEVLLHDIEPGGESAHFFTVALVVRSSADR